jgi:RecA-family ATPase
MESAVSTEQYSELIASVAQTLLGEPNRSMSSKTELRYGSRGSFSVDLRKGTWFDYETNVGGGTLDLIAQRTGRVGGDAWEWMREQGIARTNGSAQSRHATIVATFSYTDEVGDELFQVVKFDPKDFRQRRADGRGGYVWSVKGVRQVPYRLHELQERLGLGNPIFIVEGEKDADNLWKINAPATTNAGGAGKWRPELNEYFANADVIIIPDFDPPKRDPKTNEVMKHEDGRPMCPGQDHAQDIAEALVKVARSVRVIELWKYWPSMPSKGDVSDWLAKGDGSLDRLYEIAEQTPLWTHRSVFELALALLKPFPIVESAIPPRDWIVPGLLMRRHVTVLVAPSGAGKSLLTLQIGIACAQGKEWAGWRPRRKSYRVLFINAEDDYHEICRRLAAALHRMEVDQREIADRFLVANAERVVIAKFDARSKMMKVEPLHNELIELIKANQIDIVVVDPFAETFEGDENSNNELKWCGVYWREIARKAECAVCLVHHTKKYASGMAGDVDAARGASALIGIARIVSTVFPMTEKEAELMLKDEEKEIDRDRFRYLRYDDAKSNLSLTTSVAKWFRKDTITLDNKTDEQPADEVGTLKPWKAKDLLDGVTEELINKFFDAVDRGICDRKTKQPTGEFYTFDTRAKGENISRYVGNLVTDMFKIKSTRRVAKIVNTWRDNGRLLDGEPYRSPASRKERSRCISERWRLNQAITDKPERDTQTKEMFAT